MLNIKNYSLEVKTAVAEIPFLDPFQVYNALKKEINEKEIFLLESLEGPEKDRKSSLIGTHPIFTIEIWDREIIFKGLSDLINIVISHLTNFSAFKIDNGKYYLQNKKDLWALLRNIQSLFLLAGEMPNNTVSFGFFGYFGYDTAWYIEELPVHITNKHNVPDIHLTIYQSLIHFDLENNKLQLYSYQIEKFCEDNKNNKIKNLLSRPEKNAQENIVVPKPNSITDSITKEKFLQDVEKALYYISIGDIYQVQLGHEINIQSSAKPFDIYKRLRARNPSPYMYFAPFGDTLLIGASPELFLGINDKVITLRPIAGTIKRGRNETEDQIAIEKLSHDTKEIAEHIMLVDLCRNDIGRVCLHDTMKVDELMIVEKYSHVFHLVSNVSGIIQPELDAYDVIAATFPEGTMTGAPKIRAMEIIEELEMKRRGTYAGAVGIIGFNGYVNLALCIRTSSYNDGNYCIRASAGIVADSIPENEWRETLSKMGANYWVITGEEFSEDYIKNGCPT